MLCFTSWLLVLLVASAATAGAAQWKLEDRFNPGRLSRLELRGLQEALDFAGYYDGRWDGVWGKAARAGFAAFAKKEAGDKLGLVSSASRALFYGALHKKAENWQATVFTNLGVVFELPMALLGDPSTGADQIVWKAEGLSVTLSTIKKGIEVGRLQKALLARKGAKVEINKEGSGWVETRIATTDGVVHLRADWMGKAWASFTIEASAQHARDASLIAASIVKVDRTFLRDLAAGAPNIVAIAKLGAPLAEQWVKEAGANDQAATDLVTKSAGSGFFINRTELVTNEHVIDGCDSIRTEDGKSLTVVASDSAHDLALLRAERAAGDSLPVAAEREGPTLGQRVYALGYPRYGTTSHALSFTQGVVSAETGENDNPDRFSLSSDLQPGNSGGPVIGSDGRVLGVAVALEITTSRTGLGALPVGKTNFAIKPSVLVSFLDANKVAYQTAGPAWKIDEGISAAMRQAVVPVLCTY